MFSSRNSTKRSNPIKGAPSSGSLHLVSVFVCGGLNFIPSTPFKRYVITGYVICSGIWGSTHNSCELWLSPSPSCATFVSLRFDVSVAEHPFDVLVGFLLGGVAV